jgi:hypothetical protein
VLDVWRRYATDVRDQVPFTLVGLPWPYWPERQVDRQVERPPGTHRGRPVPPRCAGRKPAQALLAAALSRPQASKGLAGFR